MTARDRRGPPGTARDWAGMMVPPHALLVRKYLQFPPDRLDVHWVVRADGRRSTLFVSPPLLQRGDDHRVWLAHRPAPGAHHLFRA